MDSNNLDKILDSSFGWVLKCVEGSTTDWHFKTCVTLVQLFSDRYSPFDGPYTVKLWDELRTRARQYGVEIPFGMPGVIKAIQISS
jgi:hypothetical protein